MKISMRLEEYLDSLRGSNDTPVSLKLILEPFGFYYPSDPDMHLSARVFCESLTAEYEMNEWVDPVDIAPSAMDLGYEPAAPFLEEAPWLMVQATKRGHISLVSA